MAIPFQIPPVPKPAEINILLNSYNNIFSDFDPNLYAERTLSDDFAFIGMTFMIAASYLSFTKPEKYYLHELLVLFEPAGWFR